MFKTTINRAAKAVEEAEAIIITSGAGMGVDSGLPDYRGHLGFWRAYPVYEKLGLCFENCSNPYYFQEDPQFAWGYYGHCVNLYRDTVPHDGFHILQKWIKAKNAPYFIVTSNVDAQFQKAGFPEDKIYEVHGSLHWLQCQTLCNVGIWKNTHHFDVDVSTMRAEGALPVCPGCGKVSRPNALMFGDWLWLSHKAEVQKRELDQFIVANAEKKVVVIEMGAGLGIPTIRARTERFGREFKNTTIIRINPREPKIENGIAMKCGALEGMQIIDAMLK